MLVPTHGLVLYRQSAQAYEGIFVCSGWCSASSPPVPSLMKFKYPQLTSEPALQSLARTAPWNTFQPEHWALVIMSHHSLNWDRSQGKGNTTLLASQDSSCIQYSVPLLPQYCIYRKVKPAWGKRALAPYLTQHLPSLARESQTAPKYYPIFPSLIHYLFFLSK